jgi:transposase
MLGEERLLGYFIMSTNSSSRATKARTPYSKEFKQEALRLATSIGVSRASSDLGIHESTLYAWKHAARTEGADAFRGHGQRTVVDAELARLRRENDVLKMEREILKKAAEFWVRECQ